jgi:hypothetical protein
MTTAGEVIVRRKPIGCESATDVNGWMRESRKRSKGPDAGLGLCGMGIY